MSGATLRRLPARSIRIALFAGAYVVDVVLSTLRVAHDVLTPSHRARPAILAVPLDEHSDAQIALIANLVSMTPGTLTIDVSPDRRTLYVHAMFAGDPDAVRRAVHERIERRVKEMTR